MSFKITVTNLLCTLFYSRVIVHGEDSSFHLWDLRRHLSEQLSFQQHTGRQSQINVEMFSIYNTYLACMVVTRLLFTCILYWKWVHIHIFGMRGMCWNLICGLNEQVSDWFFWKVMWGQMIISNNEACVDDCLFHLIEYLGLILPWVRQSVWGTLKGFQIIDFNIK